MTDAQVQAAVAGGLSTWAEPLTTVTVTDDAVGERIVNAALSLPVSTFGVQDVRGLPDTLAALQGSLASNGANIGRTVTTITDSTTGDPLYVEADDRLWGYSSEWVSPLVAGLPGWQKPAPTPPVQTPSVPQVNPAVAGGLVTPGPVGSWTPPFTSPPPLPR
jgi:hypothetical protein